jgi:hypothetical protein
VSHRRLGQIPASRKGPIFGTLDCEPHLSARLHRLKVLVTPAPMPGFAGYGVCRCVVIKRRARQAGLPHTTCCLTFRATGMYDGPAKWWYIERAQQIANYESPRWHWALERLPTGQLAWPMRCLPGKYRRSRDWLDTFMHICAIISVSLPISERCRSGTKGSLPRQSPPCTVFLSMEV